MRPVSNAQGFTLLEAIVALVLISSVGVAAFGWINRSLDSLARIDAAREREVAVRNALEWMETVNPLTTPEGRTEFGTLVISWQSEVIEPRRDGVTPGGAQSLFQLALYDTSVAVFEENRELARFRVRLVGYEQIREFELPF